MQLIYFLHFKSSVYARITFQRERDNTDDNLCSLLTLNQANPEKLIIKEQKTMLTIAALAQSV
jgi:hypothetical protein